MTHPRTIAPTRRQAALALTTFAALSLAACARGGDAEFDEGGSATAPPDPAPKQPVASDGGGEASDGGGEDQESPSAEEGPATGAVIDPADAVSTITYTLPSDEIEGTMTVGFHHLRARGATMELLLTYTPDFTGDQARTLWELHGKNHSNVAPALFDRVNLKRYDILRNGGTWDGEEIWNSKQAEHTLSSGDTQAYWANFAAPEDDIETLDIGIPGAPEFEDVPIDKAPSTEGGQG